MALTTKHPHPRGNPWEPKYNADGDQYYFEREYLGVFEPGTERISPREADNAMRWAIQKMRDEQEVKEMAKKSNAVRIAMENVRLAEQQLKLTMILAENNNNDNNN